MAHPLWLLLAPPAAGLVASFVDHVFRDQVTLLPGSIL